MQIEKDSKIYDVTETSTKWVIKALDGKVKLNYELSKKDYKTLEEVEEYFQKLDD